MKITEYPCVQKLNNLAANEPCPMQQTKKLIKRAMKHRGAAFIDLLQPCPTYNDINTNEWYRERVYPIDGDHAVKDENDVLQKIERV
ncbi:MAG: hypothetical protein QXR58_00810 [Candidatus Micrarchaeaceae archaeon]